MANYIDPWRMTRLRAAFGAGLSLREAARYADVALNTAKRWRPAMDDFDRKCECGAHGGHRGWCPVRLIRHPKRQEWLIAQGWDRRARVRLTRTLILQALKTIEPQTQEILRDMTGRPGAGETASVMSLQGLLTYRVIDGHRWYARSAEVFAEVDRHTEARQQLARERGRLYRELAQWRDGQRSISTIRKWLRDRSHLPGSLSAPAPTLPQ